MKQTLVRRVAAGLAVLMACTLTPEVPAWATEPDFLEKAQVYHDYLHLALSEDREMVASLQNGVGSTRFVPGRMSVLEKGIHHVLNGYLDRIFDGKEVTR